MQPVNHFKIGLFVLLAVAATLATAVAFGASASQRPTLAYHTFFNESVQGLELGPPVKYRGVTIGVVAAIEIAPDRPHVDVVPEVDSGITQGAVQIGSHALTEARVLGPAVEHSLDRVGHRSSPPSG